MRSAKAFVTDLFTKPPSILFPLVGLAHVLWLLWTIWSDRYVPFIDPARLQILWILGYTIFWLAACDMRKWGALGYMFLTLLNIVIFLTATTLYARDMYMSNLFLIDGVFSFFLLFYFKRFGKGEIKEI